MARSVQPDDRATETREILLVRDGHETRRADLLASEEPMAIRVAGPGGAPVDVAVTMRTPGNDEDLAIGFLVSEGLIAPADVDRVEHGHPGTVATPENELLVRLNRPFDSSTVAARAFVVSASCGVCGKASLEDVEVRCPVLPPGPVVAATTILAMPDRLRARQVIFEQTGGLHAAGLFDPDGALLDLREDVGRHNAVDKVVGALLRAGLAGLAPAGRAALLAVSGRTSFEIVQKAAAARIPVVSGVSAPSSLAVELARAAGIALCGFSRGDRLNVYTHAERVVGAAAPAP